jgi:type III pantothenate kinase
MLLAIDIGNTNTVLGVFDGEKLERSWRIKTDARSTADELALTFRGLLAEHAFDALAACSTVPATSRELRVMLERYYSGVPTMVVEPGVRTGVGVLTDNPKEVGADRIANAVGAYDLYGGPSIVADFGTATTIEAVSANGEYLGGAIFPGVEISMDALFGRAAGLRRVELVEPKHVIGKSSAESIQSGMIYGFSAQVDGLVDRFVAELGPCEVIATGGLAEPIIPHSRTVQHFEPWLTLFGLRIIFERNR